MDLHSVDALLFNKDVAPFSSPGGILCRRNQAYTSTTTNGTRSGNPGWAHKNERRWRHVAYALKLIEQQRGNDTVEWKQIKIELKLLWKSGLGYQGTSLDEIISGNRAKYKNIVAISWLNIHRLFDFPEMAVCPRQNFCTAEKHKNTQT